MLEAAERRGFHTVHLDSGSEDPDSVGSSETPSDDEALLHNLIDSHTSEPRCSDLSLRITKGVVAGSATIALLALRIFMHFSTPANALIMGITGMTSQYAIQQIKPIENIEKHLIGDYSADIFLILTQIIINLPQNPIDQGIIDGALFMLFGAQTVCLVDSLWHLDKGNDRTAESMPINERSDFITILSGNTPKERWIQEIAMAVISAALLTCGYLFDANWSVLSKLGWIAAGYTIGGICYELVHHLRTYFESLHPVTTGDELADERSLSMHRSVYIMRTVEKITYIFSIALPGFFLGFNTTPTDCFAGACMGVKRKIDMISFTETPVQKLVALKRDPTAETRSTWDRVQLVWEAFKHCQCPGRELLWGTLFDVSKYLIGTIGVGGFIIWNIVVGTLDDQITLAVSGALLYLSYIFGRWINRSTINHETSSLVATSYFYSHFSLLAPALYIGINQWMGIGDIALSTYSTVKVALAVIAWCSLTWGLGTHAAERVSGRRRPKPPPVNALGMTLASDYFWSVALPLVGFQPGGG